jgi:alkylation response protein AidB-like acyl-CoA dehydrogenase
LPPEEGGAGLGPVEARLLELLFDAYRVPTSDNQLILSALREHASDELKIKVLPDLKTGRASFCLGYTEPDAGSDMAAVRTRAFPEGDDWVISGTKVFTTWAHQSDYVFLLARTGNQDVKHGALTVFLVPLDTPGIEVRPIEAMAGIRTNITYYRDVRVPDYYRIGGIGDGWQVVAGPLATEHGTSVSNPLSDLNGTMGAMFTRALQRLIDKAVDWAMTPDPATGAAPVEDPLVRRTLHAALLDIEVCHSTPGPFGKLTAAEALSKHADAIVDMAAPEGLLDRDAIGAVADGVLAWARLFASATTIYGGTSEIHRNNLARGELGLPRPR